MGRPSGSLRVLLLVGVVAVGLGGACEESKTLTVTGVEPSRLPSMGGDVVKILGTGFQASTQGMSVYFGKNLAVSCAIASNTEIHCQAPAGEVGAKVDVEVSFDDARKRVLRGVFEYYDPTK
ncbi:MAG: hypothetical protein EXR73_14165 [Myxococcales bacterium]|nr:hypothetical protein [Myxococcales bacterium]